MKANLLRAIVIFSLLFVSEISGHGACDDNNKGYFYHKLH